MNKKTAEESRPRDYRFGQKVTSLRVSRGLTQEVIANRLHVTDGAISKWENGSSKPRFNRAVDLAGILGVDVNLLLDNDAMTPDEAEAEKEKARKAVWKKVSKKAVEVYGKHPPLEVLNRFWQEKELLEESDAVIFFDILGKVRKSAKEKRILFHSPDPECLIGWLLGAADLNPLEAHLRCPKCCRTEFHPEVRSGFDLEEKICECGTRMIPDGFGIPFEVTSCARGSDYSYFRCETDLGFLGQAEDLFARFGQGIYDVDIIRHTGGDVPETTPDGSVVWDPETRKKIIRHISPMSFILFGKKKRFAPRKPEKISGPMEVTHWGPIPGIPSVVLLPGSDAPGYLPPADEFPGTRDELTRPEVMERALRDYWNYLPIYDDRRELEPPDFTPYLEGLTFSRFVDLICSVNCLYMCKGPEALARRIGVRDFTQLPFSDVDLWRLISKNAPGNMSAIARRVSGNVYHGRYMYGNIREMDREIFRMLKLPEWFEEFSQNVFAINPRSYCTGLALRLLEDARRKIRDRK